MANLLLMQQLPNLVTFWAQQTLATVAPQLATFVNTKVAEVTEHSSLKVVNVSLAHHLTSGWQTLLLNCFPIQIYTWDTFRGPDL